MSTVASKRPPATSASPTASPSRNQPRASTPTSHARARPSRSGASGLVSARAAASARRDAVESDARAEAASAVEDLQQRLAREETRSEQFMKQADVLQAKLDDAISASSRLEDRVHEFEEQIDVLNNDKRDATRQMREMETIYESERSAILKEKEELANREEEMQAVIQRLKDSLAQRNNSVAAADDDSGRPSRQRESTGDDATTALTMDGAAVTSSSPSLDGSFAPPSSLQPDPAKGKLIESLRLELAEAQIKLVETDNQDGSRLQELERLLVEARMANARLLEDNESYQLLLQEKTLKGDFAQTDFSYMSANANQDALAALEGKSSSCLADELSTAAAAGDLEADRDRRLEAELKSVKEQNKALTMYINKIIGRLLQFQDFESVLSSSGAPADINKDLPPPPGVKQPSFLQRARSMAVGTPATQSMKPRPMSYMPTSGTAISGHTDPDTAPSIPIGNLGRSASTRRARPHSEQFIGASAFRGSPDGKSSPPYNPRHSHTLFSPPALSGNPNAAARNPSGSSNNSQPAASGNLPGLRSETSSLSGTESGGVSTPPSQSPPRSHADKQTTFAGGKPRPLLLVQEKADITPPPNKRASWLQSWTGWAAGGKKEEGSASSIPEFPSFIGKKEKPSASRGITVEVTGLLFSSPHLL
ncbi:hypothetical protein L249_1513 [Ophiocordyceps polyrhachis-furcata BCC 54312]|uniref:Uncharacterized protein n=1 Tax=Ophiocordyceps polyrhachis-furcata BCC 54312 TaxID=1330021 RepID=A0A367L4C5_9HYPO|nr:hypothetical protein L249_1513 [Ophiocordyceps polyrhachis-furcata BCC 54312]